MNGPGEDPREDGRDQAGSIELGRGCFVQERSIKWSFSRSGGPGGQHVNTTETRVQMRVPVSSIKGLDEQGRKRLASIAGSKLLESGELLITRDRSRSQRDNRRECIEQLASMVVEAAVIPRSRQKTRPSKGALDRRRKSREQHSKRKSNRRWSPED